MSYFDFIIDISNSFIDYFNSTGNTEFKKQLEKCGFIKYAKVSNGIFYDKTSELSINYQEFQGKHLFKFKGQDVKLKIEINGVNENEAAIITVLNHNVAMFILSKILRTINYRYTNEHISSIRGNAQEGTSSVNKAVFYI